MQGDGMDLQWVNERREPCSGSQSEKSGSQSEKLKRKDKYRRIRSKAREQYLLACGYGKPPLPHHLTAPTQSITNGDRTDNSDEASSVRGGYTSSRERSRSRERSHEGDRPVRDERRDREAAHSSRDRGVSHEPMYGVVQTQPRSSRGKRPIPRRHTVGGAAIGTRHLNEQETERSKEAFMDMLAARYPQYAEKISSTASEDGFPVRGRSRDPRRRATVGYQQHNRSMDYEGTMSEADGPTFHRGGFVRSSLPAARSPPSIEKPSGLVFLIFRDETKKALLPNEITHLDTVRAMFVRSFPGKLTMSYLESPKRKIYILEPRTNIYYQIEDLRDIKDRTVLRVHECDSEEPQRVQEKPEVRGRTIQLPVSSQGYYGALPASAVTSQVHKAQTLPAYMHHPIYMSHDDITQSPARTAYERSRSLTPDPIRSANYAQNPIYGRMGISPERPPPPQERSVPPDRPLHLRTIPENNLMINGLKNGNIDYYDYMDAYGRYSSAPSPRQAGSRPHSRQAMSPPAVPSGPRMETTRRAFSPPPNLQSYDYIQVVPSSQASHLQGTYIAKGARANTVVTPQRATVAPPPSSVAPPAHSTTPGVPSSRQQTTWRERSPVSRHSLPLSTVPYSGSSSVQQRSQSYRVPATSERDPMLVPRPRSMTPSPLDLQDVDTTRDRIDKMEHQLANLAAWVQTAVVQSSSSTGAPSSGKSSVTSETSPLLDSASGKPGTERLVHEGLAQGFTDTGSDGTPTLSHDMKMNILAIKHQADALRSDLRSLRRLQQINKESILETVDDAWKKIKEALSTIPGAENLLIRQQRSEVDVMYKIYLEDKAQADKELADLEHAVEELRSDVLSRQCRVQMSDVEGMALVLSHVTKQLGDLKTRFPKLQERLKYVMAAEMEVIVREERFLKEEPERLDNSLKKCKKLTGTLFTLKRLASVQEHRPPQVVALSAQARIPTLEDKKAVLENIQAMIPDHEARVHGIQAAEAARQIKKKITTQQESLRFGKSLELATKALRPHGAVTSQPVPTTAAVTYHTSYADVYSTSPQKSASDTSSVISFAMPMSTSTPKSASQPPTSQPDTSATSPSILYPVMSLIRAVSPRSEQSQTKGEGDMKVKVHEQKVQGQDGKSESRNGRNVEFRSQPAILPVTSSEMAGQGYRKSEQTKGKSNGLDINNQKSAARAAFFSSLSSPETPTSESAPSTTALSIDSPTDSHSKMSPSVSAPGRGIPIPVQSSLVTMPTSSLSASPSQSSASASIVLKPSSLPVAGSSVISSQRFSPASPSTSTQSASSKPKTTFTAIPKPYSPTKSTPSPLTPESPRYRIPPSQQGIESSKRSAISQLQQQKDSVVRPKKVPPPPPPRKSSKVPGHAVLAVNAATVNGQLPKPKHSEPKISQSSVRLESKTRDSSDIIRPPKQFANIEIETKIERKSSIGSLKQFTTPLLESKRDKSLEKELSLDKDEKPPVMVGKKISASNLDIEETSKVVEKSIDLSKEKQNGESELEISKRKVVDGKVTNISAEDSHSSHSTRESSVESESSSSSSLDSQKDIWVKQKLEAVDTSTSSTQTSDQASASTDSSKLAADDKTKTSIDEISLKGSEQTDVKADTKSSDTTSGKKPKPPPPERRSSLSSKSRTDSEELEDIPKRKDSKEVIDRLV